MSQIPSDIAASSLQAGFQAQQVDKERDAERSGQVQAAKRQVRALDEAETTVETNDNDTQIFTDAEGSGSQGRTPEEEAPDQEPEQEEPDTGITRDAKGQLHLDLEA